MKGAWRPATSHGSRAARRLAAGSWACGLVSAPSASLPALSAELIMLPTPKADFGRPRALSVALGSWVHMPYFLWEAQVSFSCPHLQPAAQRKGRCPRTNMASRVPLW